MASEAGGQLLRVVRAGALAGGLRAAGMFAMLLFVACMSSWMEAGNFGSLALIISIATLAAGFGGFGQAEMNIRTIAERRASGDETALVVVPNASVGLVVWISAAIGAALAIYLAMVGYAPSLWASIFVLTISLSIMTALSGAARAGDRYALALVPKDIAWRLLAITMVGGLAMTGRTAEVEAVAPMVALATSISAAWQVFRLRISLRSLARPGPEVLSREYVLGSATIAISLFAIVALGTLDVIVVGAMISPEAAAAYFPANRLALLAVFATLPIQLVVEPRFADLFARRDLAGAQRTANAATILQFASCLLLGLTMIVSFPVYDALFPTAGKETFSVLVILVAGFLVGSMCGMAGPILLMAGQQSIMARTNVIFAGLATVLLVLAAQEESLVVIALCVSGVEVLRKLVMAGFAYRRTSILPFSFGRL